MKSVKISLMILINRRRAESGELWQPRFFDRALRTVKEYNEKVEYIHFNPVKAGLVRRPQDWRWSSVNEYSGVSAAEQKRRCGLTIDRERTADLNPGVLRYLLKNGGRRYLLQKHI